MEDSWASTEHTDSRSTVTHLQSQVEGENGIRFERKVYLQFYRVPQGPGWLPLKLRICLIEKYMQPRSAIHCRYYVVFW